MIQFVLENVRMEGRAYLRQKFAMHRTSSLLMATVVTFTGCLLWIWDYGIDPAGAQETVWLRAAILLIAIPYLAALYWRAPYRLATAAAFVTILGWEIAFLPVLERLQDGMTHGHTGFMYFILMPLLMTRGLSFVANAVLLLAIAFTPLLLAWTGFVHHFESGRFAVLVFPAAVMVIPALWESSRSAFINAKYQQRLEEEVHTDGLTGLLSRRYFSDMAARIISQHTRSQRPYALLILDIDHFKRINDTYGHPAGDKVLQSVADICGNAVRNGDLVGRWGGEEFVVLLPGADIDEAQHVAERILARVASATLEVPGHQTIRLTVSVGVAAAGTTLDELIVLADKGLYHAKQGGRNRVVCTGHQAAT